MKSVPLFSNRLCVSDLWVCVYSENSAVSRGRNSGFTMMDGPNINLAGYPARSRILYLTSCGIPSIKNWSNTKYLKKYLVKYWMWYLDRYRIPSHKSGRMIEYLAKLVRYWSLVKRYPVWHWIWYPAGHRIQVRRIFGSFLVFRYD